VTLRIAIIGSGVSGLTCAYRLLSDHEVTIFESDVRAGGHAHTHSVTLDGNEVRVDTGFIVFNYRNYPVFSQLLEDLNVASRASDMSFGMSDEKIGLEWCSSTFSTIFAQWRNLLRPSFLRMLVDIVRFNRRAKALLSEPLDLNYTLSDLLRDGKWSKSFVEWYLVPIGSSIWSADPTTFTQFPAASFARFFDNHGLLSLKERPKWRTIVGGSANYVNAIAKLLGPNLRLNTPVKEVTRRPGGVVLTLANGASEEFDHVIMALHSDQALEILNDPSPQEKEILGSISYRENIAVLHTDVSVLPRKLRARASWNWHRSPTSLAPTLTYDLSRLQGIPSTDPLCLTLNKPSGIEQSRIIKTIHYWHPVFDSKAMSAQLRHSEISGHNSTSYCGAYWGFGFHEDGARSAVVVCDNLGNA
jgi:predicted NAD/FAD-binding protein